MLTKELDKIHDFQKDKVNLAFSYLSRCCGILLGSWLTVFAHFSRL